MKIILGESALDMVALLFKCIYLPYLNSSGLFARFKSCVLVNLSDSFPKLCLRQTTVFESGGLLLYVGDSRHV